MSVLSAYLILTAHLRYRAYDAPLGSWRAPTWRVTAPQGCGETHLACHSREAAAARLPRTLLRLAAGGGRRPARPRIECRQG